jgi:phenylalanyl-tRNA synthetase beta chain
MTISYKWLSQYLPETIEPEKLSKILTAIGLEVETMEPYEQIKGSLQGLVIGKVVTCEQHPNADKLKLTTVNVGSETLLKIVCGAPNVAVGQTVVVAPVGTTIYPSNGEPLTMKLAKIRGEESQGMICAEDEIGLGNSHAGIMILPDELTAGTAAADYFKPYSDTIFEIGLTPNRMDAMSHLGVARDVCAYLTHHHKKEVRVKQPNANSYKADNQNLPIQITVENTEACPRYAGVTISNVKVTASPQWLQNALLSIGLRPINNIVDITNYILHETGQPLHAFDAAAIKGNQVIVKTLPANTKFVTLDEKERNLTVNDLMICNAEAPMCIGGVFGGLHSGVTEQTTNIFLESAWFNPTYVRRTSVHHQLRTDAATRFEKGVDISQTVQVLKRAALLIKEVAGGDISSDIVDIYPKPKEKLQLALKHHYLKKLSGKNYHPDAVKRILTALGFEIVKEGMDELWVNVPHSKPDVTLQADIVEEILRIDGLDNVEIPEKITIAPAVEKLSLKEQLREKIANYLVGQGYNEILTNSITNSAYFTERVLSNTVHMLNNLSVELNVLRPNMLPTALETIAHNLNRRQGNLTLFEFGKTYHTEGVGNYNEVEHLCIYLTGNTHADTWVSKGKPQDFFHLKGIVSAVLQLCGLQDVSLIHDTTAAGVVLSIVTQKQVIGTLQIVPTAQLQQMGIKQPVFAADISFNTLMQLVEKQRISYKELNKFPAVQRDLALVVPSTTTYEQLEAVTKKYRIQKLKRMRLFDVFESDKLGVGKKSMAINFSFEDDEKTLTDKEIDSMMQKLIQGFEKEVNAEIRK